MRVVNWYIKQGQLSKDNSYKSLVNKFLQKARQNLITMSILFELNDNKNLRHRVYPDTLNRKISRKAVFYSSYEFHCIKKI